MKVAAATKNIPMMLITPAVSLNHIFVQVKVWSQLGLLDGQELEFCRYLMDLEEFLSYSKL
jgi:hypothetical protein